MVEVLIEEMYGSNRKITSERVELPAEYVLIGALKQCRAALRANGVNR